MRVICLDHDGPMAAQEWDEIVQRAHEYDFYHLSAYHKLACHRGEGRPFLFVLEESDRFIALPLLLRPVSEVPGLESEDYLDATSVYGYAGPVCSEPNLPGRFVESFQRELQATLRQMNVVSVFSRLHPLLDQKALLNGLGIVKDQGKTVVIDLTKTVEEQWRDFRQAHRRYLNRLRRNGWKSASCHGSECIGKPLQEFIAIYNETMNRVKADPYYYFDESYFVSLFTMPGVETYLFWVELEAQIGAMGIFTLCNGIVQYHLSGTSSRFLKQAPMKLVLDEVRLWATDVGARFFHLGGGLKGRQDSLFEFKAGFSKRHEIFRVWNWVVDEAAYQHLMGVRGKEARTDLEDGFFPGYRA